MPQIVWKKIPVFDIFVRICVIFTSFFLAAAVSLKDIVFIGSKISITILPRQCPKLSVKLGGFKNLWYFLKNLKIIVQKTKWRRAISLLKLNDPTWMFTWMLGHTCRDFLWVFQQDSQQFFLLKTWKTRRLLLVFFYDGTEDFCVKNW